MRPGLSKPVFRIESITTTNQVATEIVFEAFWGRNVLCEGGFGISFLIFAALATGLKVEILHKIRLRNLWDGGGNVPVFGPS